MKKIVLNTKKDLDKFYRKIWIYKSIFYRKIKFTLENNIEDSMCQDIIDALNIKSNVQRINFIYDKACEQIDNHNKNISCGFKDGKCINQYDSERYNGCCSLCRYQSEKGCKTQNLSCKLFFCDSICKRYNVLKFKDLKILKCLSLRNQIIVRNNFFMHKETFLKELYLSSLIVYGINSIISIIKNMIFMHQKKHNIQKD